MVVASIIQMLVVNVFERVRFGAALGASAKVDQPPHVGAFSPQTSSDDWANVLLKQCWPHLSRFFVRRMTASIDESLSSHATTSRFVKAAKVKSIELGECAPIILGIVVHDKICPVGSSFEAIRTEVSFAWRSENCLATIELQLRVPGDIFSTSMPSARLLVSDVSVAGTLHIVLGPLIPAMPPARSATCYFTEKPRVDLRVSLVGGRKKHQLGGGVDFTSSIGKMLRDKIRSQLLFPLNSVVALNSVFDPSAADT